MTYLIVKDLNQLMILRNKEIDICLFIIMINKVKNLKKMILW